MHQLRYNITSLSPLLISARYGEMNTLRTLQYIPGTSVLGMIAAKFIKQKKINGNAHLNNDFYSYFLKGDVRFGNAYIVLKNQDGKDFVYFPIPASIQQEKRGKQICDLLLADEEPEVQTKTIPGFCKMEEEDIWLTEVKTGLNFHHSRDRKTGTPKTGQIFNYESIAEGQVFEGVITGSSSGLELLADSCGTSWIGYIGRSKNAQYGMVSFEVLDKTPVLVSNGTQNKVEVTLTFLSDAIFYNENGFATIDKNVLQENYFGVKIKKAVI